MIIWYSDTYSATLLLKWLLLILLNPQEGWHVFYPQKEHLKLEKDWHLHQEGKNLVLKKLLYQYMDLVKLDCVVISSWDAFKNVRQTVDVKDDLTSQEPCLTFPAKDRCYILQLCLKKIEQLQWSSIHCWVGWCDPSHKVKQYQMFFCCCCCNNKTKLCEQVWTIAEMIDNIFTCTDKMFTWYDRHVWWLQFCKSEVISLPNWVFLSRSKHAPHITAIKMPHS